MNPPELSPPLLQVRGLSKAFGAVQALDNVQLNLRAGEVLSLLGENGAGKSTLIKCMTGAYKMDTGDVLLEGRKISPKSPHEAEALGISTVYQEVNLLPNLSVAENIALGRFTTNFFGKVNWSYARKRAAVALSKLGLSIDLDEKLGALPVALQQMVALARALDVDAKVLILDEPTASLDEKEVESLFKILNQLRADGMGIIFISHFLGQVFELSDRMTILRNGQYVTTHDAKDLSRQDLLKDMLGKAFDEMQGRPSLLNTQAAAIKSKPVVMSLEGLGASESISDVSFELKQGEVLGLAGLLGSGRTETVRLVFGIDKADSGSISLNGKTHIQGNTGESINNGILLASEDRKTEGIFPNLSVRENMLIALQNRRGMFNPISEQEGSELAKKYIDTLKIKTAGPEAKVSELSGGNQQKVLLARWLAAKPKVLLLDEPTRGIDIGARAEIEKLIEKLSSDGLSIILISSELDEEVRCCHRVLVLRDREIIGELDGEAVSEESIINLVATHGE